MQSDPSSAKKTPSCPRCGNRLRLRPDQLGEEIKCPKCNSVFTIGRPSKAVAKGSPAAKSSSEVASSTGIADSAGAADSLVDDDSAYEPEIPLAPSVMRPINEPLNPQVDLTPMEPIPSSYLAAHEADWSTGELEREPPTVRPLDLEPDHLAAAAALGYVRDNAPPDPPPQYTFFSGVFGYPWQGPCLFRWILLALAMAGCGGILIATAAAWKGEVSLTGPLFAVASAISIMVTFTFAAVCLATIVQDTADGHWTLQESDLPDIADWFLWAFRLLSIAMLSGALGYPLIYVETIGPFAVPLSMLILFPILLLSALEADSFMFPFSRPVFQSLTRAAGAWIGFYTVSTAVIGLWLVATDWGLRDSPYLAILLSGVAAAAVWMIYARLLGRLAWKIGGSLPAQDYDDEAAPVHRSKRSKRQKFKIRFPDDLDPSMLASAERRPGDVPQFNPRRRP